MRPGSASPPRPRWDPRCQSPRCDQRTAARPICRDETAGPALHRLASQRATVRGVAGREARVDPRTRSGSNATASGRRLRCWWPGPWPRRRGRPAPPPRRVPGAGGPGGQSRGQRYWQRVYTFWWHIRAIVGPIPPPKGPRLQNQSTGSLVPVCCPSALWRRRLDIKNTTTPTRSMPKGAIKRRSASTLMIIRHLVRDGG